MTEETLRKEYFATADTIDKKLKSIAVVYPDIAKELDTLIGKYVSLHMKLYAHQ